MYNPYKKLSLNEVEYKEITVSELLNWVKKSKSRLVLPSLQRKFVWKHSQICELFDSTMQGYPIGTLMFWRISTTHGSDKNIRKSMQFYEFVQDYNKLELGGGRKIESSDLLRQSIISVIDGQQRITAFNIALRGTYDLKKSKRRLYLNLNFNSDNENDDKKYDKKYDFQFLNPEIVKGKYKNMNDINDSTPIWFKVQDVMDYPISGYNDKNRREGIIKKRCEKKSDQFVRNAKKKLIESIKSNEDNKSEIVIKKLEKNWKRYSNILHTLHHKIHCDTPISYFELEKTDVRDVIEIFMRINNAGTNLSKTQMLMSVLSAQWPHARDKVDSLLKEINDNGEWDFDENFVMRAALVLLDGDVLLNSGNLFSVVGKMQNDWEWIRESIVKMEKTVSALGFSDRNLRSYNAMIPIVYYFSKSKNGTPNKKARDQILFYLNSVSVLGVFGVHADQALTKFRDAMRLKKAKHQYELAKDQREYFNYHAIIEKWNTDSKPIKVNGDMIHEFIEEEYGQKTLAILIAINPKLYKEFDVIHQDHIYPLKGNGYKIRGTKVVEVKEEEHSEFYKKLNSLPNLHLMWEVENLEKQALEPTKYFSLFSKNDKKTLKDNSLIPLEIEELTYANFENFHLKRKKELKEKLYQIFYLK